MKMYWVKTGKIIKRLFGGYVWDAPGKTNTIYLTFDDGPAPGVTPWVLELLEKENIKATFFCIGDNIDKHPELFKQTVAAGHSIGNHTYNHLKGWKTDFSTYIKNTERCEAAIKRYYSKSPVLFRPPYGKIRRKQAQAVRKMGYKIIMWDVLSADFDQSITPQKCLKNVTDNAKDGSIIIFHDSLKAEKNLRYALPWAISILKEKGFEFAALT